MREVVISQIVQDKLDNLELFLKNELRLSKYAAKCRCDRMGEFLNSLRNEADYSLCRFKKWHMLGYRCVVFEKSWVFAYELFDEGVIIRDMSNVALLVE